MAKSEFQEYPRMVYGPQGEQLVVKSAGEVPEGYKNHPSEHEAKAETKPKAPARKLSKEEAAKKAEQEAEAERQRFRSEAIAFLKAAGVEMQETATDAEIEAALNDVEKGKG